MKTPKLENEPLFFSFEGAVKSLPDIPANMPEWTTKLIKESKEWEKLSAKETTVATAPTAEITAVTPMPPGDQTVENDDVPF